MQRFFIFGHRPEILLMRTKFPFYDVQDLPIPNKRLVSNPFKTVMMISLTAGPIPPPLVSTKGMKLPPSDLLIISA